jgi:hypothetical protein
MLDLLAQTYTYTTETSTTTSGGASIVLILLYLAFLTLIVVGSWKVYTKAGKPGWASIVPIYNIIVELQIIGRPIWWVILLFIPIVNIAVAIILAHDMAKSFGKGMGMTLLLFFVPFIGLPILGFGNAKYVGPAASGGSAPAAPSTPVAAAPEAPVDTNQQPPAPIS